MLCFQSLSAPVIMLRKGSTNYAYTINIATGTGKVDQKFKKDNSWNSGANGQVSQVFFTCFQVCLYSMLVNIKVFSGYKL